MQETIVTNTNASVNNKLLFWGCFIALAATAFGFVVRTMVINEWAVEFGLSETQKGEILGVGLWPFAISIVLFSLIIDKTGYRNAMLFGFFCHLASAIVLIFANGYWMLYFGTFLTALGNGTVEAYINPVIATLYKKEKTKWLNILHAGWPGGLVVGGLFAIALGNMHISWQVKVGLIIIPTITYGIMLYTRRFPVNERVAAGVPYKEMLKEVGVIGALIIVSLTAAEVGRIFGFSRTGILIPIVALTAIYGAYTRSLGNALFLFFLVIMIPLATTELGTDSWITSLMEPELQKLGMAPLWVLIYTSAIMTALRFFAGPIVHKLSPLGLLAACSVIAALGLVFLSTSSGLMILAAATFYGIGKTFFWPTTLGVVSERFPKGGVLTLNGVGAVGMLGAGIIGSAFLGNIQDKGVDRNIAAYDQAHTTTLHTTYVTQEKTGIFGAYKGIDNDQLSKAPGQDAQVIANIQSSTKKEALRTIAILPAFMLVCYLGLMIYFKKQGGYKAIELTQ